MTDFGANIFDDAPRPDPTPPPPTRKPRSRRKPKATDEVDAEAIAPPAPALAEPAGEVAAPLATQVVEPEPLPKAAAPDPAPAEVLHPDGASRPTARHRDHSDSDAEVHNPFPPADHHGPDDGPRDRERHQRRTPSAPPRRDHHGARSHGDRDRREPHGHDRGQRHGQPFAPPKGDVGRARHPQAPQPQQPAQPRPQHLPEAQRPVQRPPAPPAQAVTVNAVIDLDQLQDEAVAQQGELAMARLRLGLGGSRAFGRGIALARNRNTPPAGFGLELFGDDFAGGVRLAGAAFGLAGPDRVVVLAPATKPMLTLARALHAAGHAVEVCGFTNPENHPKVRLLGRDCLFVP